MGSSGLFGHGAAVVVEGLTKTYGQNPAVRGVSFRVERGEIFGLLGPNGSGKTTTVECVQALRKPDAGSIRVLGLDPATEPGRVRRLIGSQLQETALPDRIKVWEALHLAAALTDRPADCDRLIEQWGLSAKRAARFSSLSGGQRQRLFVALALVNQPSVVFLDEMTTGLDPTARRLAWELIREIRGQGATVVLVTHFMDEAAYLCDRVAVLIDGTIVATGTPQGLAADHLHHVRVTFSAPGRSLPDLSSLGVRDVVQRGAKVEMQVPADRLARVAHDLVDSEIDPSDFSVVQPSLEDVYLDLTRQAGRSPE
jgi:ABC-2 type transport system ATP-binding protein